MVMDAYTIHGEKRERIYGGGRVGGKIMKKASSTSRNRSRQVISLTAMELEPSPRV